MSLEFPAYISSADSQFPEHLRGEVDTLLIVNSAREAQRVRRQVKSNVQVEGYFHPLMGHRFKHIYARTPEKLDTRFREWITDAVQCRLGPGCSENFHWY